MTRLWIFINHLQAREPRMWYLGITVNILEMFQIPSYIYECTYLYFCVGSLYIQNQYRLIRKRLYGELSTERESCTNACWALIKHVSRVPNPEIQRWTKVQDIGHRISNLKWCWEGYIAKRGNPAVGSRAVGEENEWWWWCR